ncbi:MAG: hypothetical protein NW224_13720 [Leptolyngbyaceae cyanobacterium bins.302]|nr:hypothetical protein [Leptolyngbyaceae cyanobacterium bins.302]
MGRFSKQRLAIASLLSPLMLIHASTVLAAPPLEELPVEEVPEEILRTQIILDARSPIDGKPMTPAEYAELQAKEQAPFQPPAVSQEVKDVVGALRVRRFIKKFLPFIPIK